MRRTTSDLSGQKAGRYSRLLVLSSRIRTLVLVTALSSIAACASTNHSISRSIFGVWQVSQIDREPTANFNPVPLPSRVIFTERHYSFMWMPGEASTKAFATRWQPTDKEKIRRFGEVFFNEGIYQLDEDQLIVFPSVARVPEFEGGRMAYRVRWQGEAIQLALQNAYTFDDVAVSETGQVRLTLT